MNAVLKPEAPHLAPMTELDLPEVMAIENDVYEFPWTRGNFRDSLEAGYSCWLYRQGGTLIGYAILMVVIDEAHLLNLSIARRCWRGGHGRALLEAVAGTMRGHGASSMFLEVRPTNVAGRALYAGAGFRQIGVRRGYYPAKGGREDALVLSRPL
jgi:ribosomal-protein-alanine N-acetyltransferase